MKGLAKEFHVRTNVISDILNNSNDEIVQSKLSHHLINKISKPCTFPNCANKQYSQGLCKMHYFEKKKFGRFLDETERVCCVCGKQSQKTRNGQRYCQRHYVQLCRYGKILAKTKFDKNDYQINEKHITVFIEKASKTYEALISLESLPIIKGHKLHLRNDGYLSFKLNGKDVLLHRYLMGFPNDNLVVDHINRNRLDNRLENLRIVDAVVNALNSNMMKNNTSGYTGITWDKSRNKWKATLNINNKRYNIGRFDNIEDAVIARRNYEKMYHDPLIKTGERLN